MSRLLKKWYGYDGSHQLIAIEHADGVKSEYEYDALRRRVAKHHTVPGTARRTTLFMWDGDWMMQEILPGKTAHRDASVTYVPHSDHEGPLTRLADGQAWHYVTDHLGTPLELYYNEVGELAWAADFSAYGQTVRQIAEVDNPIRFPGQYLDAESGLHYNRHRYYDPQVGRYMNQDPIGLVGGWNCYAYVGGDPVSQVDPKGLAACTVLFPDYPIEFADGMRSSWLGGHGGVLAYDANGATQYYEFGRYSPNAPGIFGARLSANEGNVRRVSVPNLILGKDGKPTDASLKALREALSLKLGIKRRPR